MNMKTKYKVLNEASELTRALSMAAINGGLDELKRGDITSEMREEMVNKLKGLLESRARAEEVDREFEYRFGRFFGSREAHVFDMATLVACAGIVHVVCRKMR